jgi:hypothetical protein
MYDAGFGILSCAAGSMPSSATLQTPYTPHIQYLPSYLLAYFYSALDTPASFSALSDAQRFVSSWAKYFAW